MHNVNKTSNKVAFPIIFFSLLTAGAFGVLAYFGVSELIEEMRPILQANAAEKAAAQAWDLVLFYYSRFWYAVFPAVLGFALLAGILAWLIVRSSIRRLTPAAEGNIEIVKQGPEKEKQDLAERRMFLHLFSMMQREGRLMDFLAEDLDQYEDSQIGSAVRAIHAGCRRIVQEYLDPQPVCLLNVMDIGNGVASAFQKIGAQDPAVNRLPHCSGQHVHLFRKMPTQGRIAATYDCESRSGLFGCHAEVFTDH